jgi:hypothetical protein
MTNWSYWYKNSIVTESSEYEASGNITLDAKYLFVGFLQGFFKLQSRYK